MALSENQCTFNEVFRGMSLRVYVYSLEVQ